MARQIFRQAALNRLSTPEQLDQLIEIPVPRAWLVAAAVAAFLVSALLWGLFGSISSGVSGEGALRPDPEREGPLTARITLPPGAATRVQPGQAVQLFPTDVDWTSYGALRGIVRAVGVSTDSSPSGALGWADVALMPAPQTASGYAWTAGGGPPRALVPGEPCRAEIVLGQRRPLAFLWSQAP